MNYTFQELMAIDLYFKMLVSLDNGKTFNMTAHDILAVRLHDRFNEKKESLAKQFGYGSGIILRIEPEYSNELVFETCI